MKCFKVSKNQSLQYLKKTKDITNEATTTAALFKTAKGPKRCIANLSSCTDHANWWFCRGNSILRWSMVLCVWFLDAGDFRKGR